MRSRAKTEPRTPQITDVPFVDSALRGDGQALPAALRETLEPERFV